VDPAVPLERWPLRPPTLGIVALNVTLGGAGATQGNTRFQPCNRSVAEAATAPQAQNRIAYPPSP